MESRSGRHQRGRRERRTGRGVHAGRHHLRREEGAVPRRGRAVRRTRAGSTHRVRRPVELPAHDRCRRLLADRPPGRGPAARRSTEPPSWSPIRYADPADVAAAGGGWSSWPSCCPGSTCSRCTRPSCPDPPADRRRRARTAARSRDGDQHRAREPGRLRRARGRVPLPAGCSRSSTSPIPSPCPADSPLRAVPNVMVTPHIAGSLGTEIHRLTDHTLGRAHPLGWPANPCATGSPPTPCPLHA